MLEMAFSRKTLILHDIMYEIGIIDDKIIQVYGKSIGQERDKMYEKSIQKFFFSKVRLNKMVSFAQNSTKTF